MKNEAINQSNNRFYKVQEELKSLFSIIMGVIEESAQEEPDFEHFTQNATSEEEVQQIKELQASMAHLDKKAHNFQQNVGEITHKSHRKPTKKEVTKEPTTFNEIKPIAPKTISNDTTIHRIVDDFSNER